MLLSICMMVKNEEENLTRCLNGVQNILRNIDSELIIVDTGSTDGTVEIAKKYTDKVYFQPWENDFSAMRNKTISYAKGQWLFILDADEEIVDDSGIIEFFKLDKKQHKFNTLCIALRNFNLRQDSSVYADINAVRFFKNDGDFHYESIIHELPIFKEPVGSLTGIIYHYGYVNDDAELMEKKFVRTISLINKALLDEPKNIYLRYQLSVSYAMHGDWKASRVEAFKAYEYLETYALKDRNEFFYLYGQLMTLYKYFGEPVETLKIGEEALLIRNKDIDTYFYIADAYLSLNQTREAIPSLIKYLDLIRQYEKRELFINVDVKLETVKFKTKGLSNLLYLLYEDFQYKEVLSKFKLYAEFISTDEPSKSIFEIVIKSAIKENEYVRIYELYSNDNVEIKEQVRVVLEKQLIFLSNSEREQIYEVIKKSNDVYGKANRLRLLLGSENNNSKDLKVLMDSINGCEESEFIDIYFDYYIKNGDKDSLLKWIIEFSKDMDLATVDRLMHLSVNFESWAKQYIAKTSSEYRCELILINLIQKYFLMQQAFQNKASEAMPLFNQFVEIKKQIIDKLYRPEFIENEKNWVGIESTEDRFCLYMEKALSGNIFEAASYLKKTLPIANEFLSYVHLVIFEKEAEMSKK